MVSIRLLVSGLLWGAVVVASSPMQGVVQCADDPDVVGELVQPQENNADDVGIIKFPPMPPLIRAVLHEDWKSIGVDGILESLKSPGVLEFSHGRDTFYSHLKGTYGILKAWGQPDDIW